MDKQTHAAQEAALGVTHGKSPVLPVGHFGLIKVVAHAMSPPAST
jgi:hypothetical protein